MMESGKLLIEVMYKSKASLPCVYMEETALQVLPAYVGRIIYSRVDLSTQLGAKRFLKLSCSLFGVEGVYKYHRLAPVPSLFINAGLVFDAIPSRDELQEAIEAYITQNDRFLPDIARDHEPVLQSRIPDSDELGTHLRKGHQGRTVA